MGMIRRLFGWYWVDNQFMCSHCSSDKFYTRYANDQNITAQVCLECGVQTFINVKNRYMDRGAVPENMLPKVRVVK